MGRMALSVLVIVMMVERSLEMMIVMIVILMV